MNPILRFKEFQDDYLVGCINDVTASLNSGVSVNSYDFPVKSAEEYGILKTSCISNGIFNYSENKKVIESDIERAKNSVKQDTIIVSRMNTPALVGEIGYIYQSFTNLFVPDRLWVLTCIKGNNAKWLTYCLISQRVKAAIKNRATGTSATMKNISKPSFLNVKISIPVQEEEQHKIADFLSVVDKKISMLKEKHALLVQYKKGVIQKLFSQVIRFKDGNGNDFSNWEEKKGNKVFRAMSNKNHNSDLPILAITQDQGAIPRDLINYQVQVTENSVASYKVVEKGDFIISLRSFQGGIEYSNYKGICSPAYIILQPLTDIDDDFYRYYLKTSNFIQEMKKRLEGIRDGKILSYKYFSEINLPYPCVQEQQKIAQFLQVIDKKINLVNQQIAQTQTFKKGLLQQMFV